LATGGTVQSQRRKELRKQVYCAYIGVLPWPHSLKLKRGDKRVQAALKAVIITVLGLNPDSIPIDRPTD